MNTKLDKVVPEQEQQTEEPARSLIKKYAHCCSNKGILRAKLQDVRKDLISLLGGKSGKNAFQKFEYFETKDFLPQIIELLADYNLYYDLDFNEGDICRLKIFDNETDEYTIISKAPCAERAKGNENQQQQSIGKIYTYTERYLFMKGFGVVENDKIDGESGKHKLSVDEVNHHMQDVGVAKDMDKAKQELNKLKIENKITQKTYEVVYNNIAKAGGKK